MHVIEITQLSLEQVQQHYDVLSGLLEYCKVSSSGECLPRRFYDNKILQMQDYLRQDKAYVFAAIAGGKPVGFLWACEICKNDSRRFHVLYLAVLPEYQSGGIGKRLISLAEQKALELDIQEIELNVHSDNQKAMRFYSHQNFNMERITMVKKIAQQ